MNHFYNSKCKYKLYIYKTYVIYQTTKLYATIYIKMGAIFTIRCHRNYLFHSKNSSCPPQDRCKTLPGCPPGGSIYISFKESPPCFDKTKIQLHTEHTNDTRQTREKSQISKLMIAITLSNAKQT